MGESERAKGPHGEATQIVHAGRNPAEQHGFVNTPVYRGSTVLFPDVATLESGAQRYTYGRKGSPTISALEEALAALEGGHRTVLAPSGLAAVTTALLAFAGAGDHILVTDSVYRPARHFCDTMLKRLGVETTYYDPHAGAEIAGLVRPNTRLIYAESPGSQTFEVQDIPALAKVARARDIRLLMDNTWGTQLYFKAFEHGVDVSIHAATKYVVGHSDAMLGAVTANERSAKAVVDAAQTLGMAAGTEEIFLGLRGLRTMGVRLEHHWRAGLEMARWLAARPEVAQVLHPALPGAPGHELWKRDFKGACGLFGVVLKPAAPKAVSAMLDHLELFGMGYSWGGYESLVVPFDPSGYRTATRWAAEGPALRIHIGLEDVEDLKRDLAAGFDRLKAA
ncbi:MAG: cystathionine beta-lyase [Hyphomicrobiaceae bacterium]